MNDSKEPTVVLPMEVIAKIISHTDKNSFRKCIAAFHWYFPNLNNYLKKGKFSIYPGRIFYNEKAGAVNDIMMFDKCFSELRALDYEPRQKFRDLESWKTCPSLKVNVSISTRDDKVAPFSNSPNIKNLTSFILSGSRIGDEGVRAISNVLSTGDTNLKTLWLLNNWIRIDGMREIALGLKAGNVKLSELYIADDEVGNLGAKAISDYLKSNKTLTKLTLTSTGIQVDGASAIAEAIIGSTLRELDLSDNRIADIGAAALANALKRGFSKLIKLILYHNVISNEGVRAICDSLRTGNSNLKKLDLSRNLIGDNGAILIAETLKKTKLSHVPLSSNQIGANGAIALAEAFSHLEISNSSSLTYNPIGENGAMAIARMYGHYDLKLAGNQIGDAGAVKISSALKRSTKDLNLSLNRIGDIGAAAIAKSLGSFVSNLTYLILLGNQIGDEGAISLAALLQSGVKELIYLDLSRNRIRNEGAKAFANCVKVGKPCILYLAENMIGNEGALSLTEMLKSPTCNFTDVSIHENPIDSKVLTAFKELQKTLEAGRA